jgi:YD repeat-containing protein
MVRWLTAIALAAGIAAVSTAAVAGTVTYTYDAQGRVVKAVYSDGYTITYTYDAAGNRTAYVVTS